MKLPSEQELAGRILAQRDDGYSLAYILRQNSMHYALNGIVLLIFLIGFFVADIIWFRLLVLFFAGILIGSLIENTRWINFLRRQWPFTRKIIDWQKIEEIALHRNDCA